MTLASIRRAAVLPVALALGACTYYHGDLERLADQTDRDFRRDPTKTYSEVSLEAVLHAPSSYRYIDLRFSAVLNRVGEKGFTPFWTPFLSENYISFSVWSTAADLTNPDARSRSHPLLFIHRNNPSVKALLEASRFSRVRIEGRVGGDYDQMAWIDVARILVEEEEVYTEDALADLALAKEALAAKKGAQAVRFLEDALKGIWLAETRYWIYMKLGGLQESAGNLEAAKEAFEGALRVDHDSTEAVEAIARVKKALKERAASQP
jgi:tetratricopeptide (TPR) repeat protein